MLIPKMLQHSWPTVLLPLTEVQECAPLVFVGIVSKAVLYCIKSDVLEAARSLQLCSGHETGCEAAIHSMCCIFHDAMTEAVLLVDVNNTFNSLNLTVALLNIHQLSSITCHNT